MSPALAGGSFTARPPEKPIYCLTFGLGCAQLLSHVRLCEPMDCSPSGSSVRGGSPGNSTGVGCHALLQGILPNQGSNLGLLHWRSVTQLCPTLWSHGLQPVPLLCPRNSPGKRTGVGCCSLLQGIFPAGDQTQVSHTAGRFFTSWAVNYCCRFLAIPPPSGLFKQIDFFFFCKLMFYCLNNFS